MAQVACSETDRRILPAFLLLLFFGAFGAHAFYARRKWRGVAYLCIIGCLLFATLYRHSAHGGDVETLRDRLLLEHLDHSTPVSYRDADLQDAANQEQAYNELTKEPSDKLTNHWAGTWPQTNVVAELIANDDRLIEHANTQKRISEIISEILGPMPALLVISWAILLIVDLIRIITGTFRDENGAKLSRWT
jgi:hypothetical protein